MTCVRALIQAHLRQIGADGLCNPDDECGCGADDLCPCDRSPLDCVPARAVIATEDGDSYDQGDTIYQVMGATP